MRAVAIWICCCAYLTCAGWILSAMHKLDFAGYAGAAIFGIGALVIWRTKTSKQFLPEIHWQKIFRRFCKLFPLIFLLVAILEFIGGAIHAPNNYDALTYRLPRMLSWLGVSHWFWIPTINERMNYSTTEWEWIAMPFFVFFHSDRGLFLINAVGFFLMPGLLFVVFRQIGIARRVAWTWIWILPLAYGFTLQGGSVGNDFPGVLFALGAVAFCLRARRSGKISDIWLGGLAAALMTNAKLSDLPLLLPCLVAVWPVLTKLRERLVPTFAVTSAAILISAAPTIILNQIYTGSWNGDLKNIDNLEARSPAAAFFGNGLLLLEQSFMPPVLPGSHKIEERLNEKMPTAWQQTLKEKFPRYYLSGLNELPQEESSGLGLGITLLLLTVIGATLCGIGAKKSKPKTFSQASLVGWAACIAALVYMLKMGSEATARLMLPYYPLVIVLILLLPAQNWLLRFRAWKFFAALCALSVLPAVILSPSRPLFPAVKISAQFAKNHPGSAVAQRLATVYSTYSHRNDALAPLRNHVPDNIKKIGFVAGSNDTDYSLWRPFGQRQVIYLQDNVKNSAMLPDDIEWIVVKQATWPEFCPLPLEEWAAQHHAKIVASVSVVTLIAWGDQTWCLLQIEK